ncbi:hypothetical protein H4S04_000376 [Coemansia sp. S16]|nr:hypothetical protein H4S04_000376 [Coemansia sp. S16]
MALPALQRQRQAQIDSNHDPLRTLYLMKTKLYQMCLVNIQGLELRQSLLGHDGCVNALSWSWDGQLLFSGSDDSTICVWRAAGNGSLLSRFSTGFSERVFDLKLLPAPNDHLLIACSMDASIKVFDVNRILAAANSASIFANTVRLSEDSIVDGSDCCVRTFAVHSAPVKRAAIIPDAPFEFLSCSEDGTARHFDIRERLPSVRLDPDTWQRGGQIVADYHKLRAELHALDVNAFHPFIFAVGGSLTSIMVHDRRMPYSGLAHCRRHPLSANWAGDQCVVRLRRDRLSSKHTIQEKISDSTVTGLRFSRDTPNLVVGSWCYDHVYLFDLNHSPTYTSTIRDGEACLLSKIREREAPGDPQLGLPLVKRVRSNEPTIEPVLDVDDDDDRYVLDWSESYSEGHDSNSDVDDGHAVEPANLVLSRSSGSVHGYSRGRSYGVRFLSNEEAPYLLESDGEHDGNTTYSGNSDSDSSDDDHLADQDSRCVICCRATHELETAMPAQEAAAVDQPCSPSRLSHSERDLIHVSFDAFVTDVADQLLVPALGSISFAIRQLDGEGTRPRSESLAALQHLDAIERIDELRGSLLTLQLDGGLDHDRARSLLYNNRACVNATIFRQKWVRRFDAYLRAADLHSYDLETIRHISAEFKAIKSELESAARDSVMALQLNRYNILAHYNRMLVSWDSMRLEIMLWILELFPLIQPAPRHGDNEPLLNRLRAELGDLSYRMRELQFRFHSECDSVRKEAQSIHCFAHVVDRAGKEDEGSNVLGCLVHSNDHFFEVSSRLAATLSEDADLVLCTFNQSRDIFADSLLNSEANGADRYASAMHSLSMCWKTLGRKSSTAHLLPDNLEARQDVFGVELFASDGQAVAEPHVYLWHRHFPSISSRRIESCGVLSSLGIDDMPTLPIDSIYRVCPDDDLTTDIELVKLAHPRPDSAAAGYHVDHASAIALPVRDITLALPGSFYHGTGSTTSSSHSRQDVDDSVTGHTNIDTPSSRSDPDNQLTGNDWPRQTREYLPTHKSTHDHSSPHPSSEGIDQTDSEQALPSNKSSGRTVPVVSPCRRYKGHCNFQTIKDVNFLLGDYVASGSDDGSLFIWDRSTMEVVQIICGDSEVVNAIECHPSLPILAVSGIDSEVQIFSLSQGGPLAAHRNNFPLVRAHHFAESNITDRGIKQAYVDAVYARDPYEQALERSGHPALPANIDIGEIIKHIPRPFPAVSFSKLWEQGRVMSQNEDMRLAGLANATLTRQMMHNIMFGNMFGADDNSDNSDDDDDDDDSSNSSSSGSNISAL